MSGTGESEEAGRWFKDPEDVRFAGGKAEVTGVWKELAWSLALKTVESGPRVTAGTFPTRGRFEPFAGAESFEASTRAERSGTEDAASRDLFPILRLISERVVSSLSISDKGDVRIESGSSSWSRFLLFRLLYVIILRLVCMWQQRGTTKK